MRHPRLALQLHMLAVKFDPLLPLAIRQAVINELANEHQASQQLAQHQHHVAMRAARQ